MVTCGNTLENCQVCAYLLKIYWATFSNTSGNMLKIITNKNGAKFPEKYSNMYGKAYGNPW